MRLRPGALVLDRYRIARTLGSGGTATTYLAHDLLWQADVALKLLRAASPTLLDALKTEFDILRGRSHPNLTNVHDFSTLAPGDSAPSDTLCFYTCDAIDGSTLLEAAKGSDWDALLQPLADVLNALHWLHALRIRHGDVKPSNILVRSDGRGVLIDLGCARPIDLPAGTSISGTPAFLAPELLDGKPGDARADLFALGKTLDLLSEHITLPDVAAKLASRLQQRDPMQRPSSAEEVLECLGREPAAWSRVIGRSGSIVGRDEPLRTADRLLDSLVDRREDRRVLWLLGPRGVGRTRLMHELKWRAQHRCRVAEVNARAPRALHDSFARASREPLSVNDLDALLRAREKLASDPLSPVVMLIDDASDLVEEQADALCALLRAVESRDAMLLAIASTEAPPSNVDAQVITLSPLSETDVATWIGNTLDVASATRVASLAGGFPSAVRALLDQLERGDLSDADLRFASVPLSERATQAAARLNVDAKRTLGLLVLSGGSLSPIDLDLHHIDGSGLVDLAEAGFAERDNIGWKLVRVAEGASLLEALGDELVRELHLEVARALDSLPVPEHAPDRSDREARRVLHFARAGQADLARTRLLASAPLHDLAPRTWLEAARAVHASTPDPEIGIVLARIEQLAGDAHRARERLTDLLDRENDPDRRTTIAREIGACAMALGDVAGAIDVLRPVVRDESSFAQRASASHLLARALIRKGAYREALEICIAGLEHADTPSLAFDLLETEAQAHAFLDETDAARGCFEQASARWPDVTDPRRLVRSHGSRALMEYRAGNLEAAARGYEQALELAERHGLSDQVATAALNNGTLCHQRGDWGSALASYERGMRMAVALGQVGTECVLRFNLAKLFTDIGQFDRGWAAAERCIEAAGRAKHPLMVPAARTVLADVAAARRQFDRAEQELVEARAAFEARGNLRECAEVDLQLADVVMTRGDESRAAGFLSAARSALSNTDAGDVRLRLDLASARLALLRGRPQDALSVAEAASRGAGEIGQRDLQAEAHLLLAAIWDSQGSALLAKKQRDRAQEVWEEAAARLPESMRQAFWRHPRRAALRSAPDDDNQSTASRREHKLELLIDINKRLNSSVDTQQVLTRAMDAAVELTGAERGFVLLVSEGKVRRGKELEVAVARNIDREQVGRSHLKFSRAIAEQVVRDGQPVVTANARDDMRFRDNRSVHAMQLQSVVCVPVQSPRGKLGALYLDNRFRQGRFGKDDVDLLLALADQVALALDNARLVAELRQRNVELERERKRVEALAKGQAAEIDRLNEVVRSVQRNLERRFDYSNIIGSSRAMQSVFDVLDRVIETSLPVLIQGESGTGKELIARAVHYQGPHRDGPLVSLNCGAMPEALLESELFGHRKGAFTGADRDRQGLVLDAKGGTLFLDELGELPLSMQVKLLRVLQEREVRPLGASKPIPVDFRLVCATNRRLADEVRKGTFREDLFYRVSVIEVTIPPLRERLDDIPALAQHVLERAAERTKRKAPGLTRHAVQKLMSFHWPGNVRQLENALLRAMVLAEGDRIRAEDIALPDPAAPPNALTRDEFERREMEEIAGVLAQHRWNVAFVARALGIPRPTLYRKLKRYGLVRARDRG